MDDFFFYIYDDEADITTLIEADVDNEQELEFFFDEKVRKVWHKREQEWYFSIVDVCQVLTDSADGRKYWNKLKQRLSEEGNETVTNCHQLKMKASDGKMRKTDAATTEQLFRIIQSIPSKKAEPFKIWLARVGAERLDEFADPELAVERAKQTYRDKGYSEEWIIQRFQSIGIRNALTDEWKRSGVKNSADYARLTDIMTKAWSGKSTREYKEFKGLKKASLRDNMTDIELTLNQLAEVSTTALSQVQNPDGVRESMKIASRGGKIAGNARLELEQQLGRSVISPLNASNPSLLDEKNKK